MSLRHVLKSQQFDLEFLDHIFRVAKHLKIAMQNGDSLDQHPLAGRILYTLFYEPSTRTRMSFETAAMRLGMSVTGTENAREFSSAVKGETLEDTFRVLCQYRPDVIVLRHPETGAAERAAAVSSVPIVNTGDGSGQHPTQALLDLYTIWEHFRNIDGLNVVMVGDMLNGRTVRSLTYLLTKFNDVTLTFVSPHGLEMGRDIIEWLKEKGIRFMECNAKNYPTILAHADVVYCTRIQKERGSSISDETRAKFRIGKEQMAMMSRLAILMHPLPRVDEIPSDVDSDPRAMYFEQAGNGMYVRMALLLWILHKI